MSSLDQAFIKAYMQQGAVAASPASAPRAMPLADALVERERERSGGRANASLDGVMAALQRQPRCPVEPPPKSMSLPPEPDARGAESFPPPVLRQQQTPEREPAKPEPNDPAKPFATLADFGITEKTYRVDRPVAPAEAIAAEPQIIPPPHLGGEGRESPAATAVAVERSAATAVEPEDPVGAHRSEAEAFSASDSLAPPFHPLLQVDRFVWPPVSNRLVAVAGRQLDQFCEAFVAAKARGQKVLAIGGCQAGEGATTLLLCVARRLSERGLRIALIDADPHEPQLARRLGLQIECGWEAVLSGQLPLAEVAVESSDRRLLLLPLCQPQSAAGTLADNSSVAGECIDTLAAEYDLVLVDLGPLERAAGGKAIPGGIGQRLDAAVLVQDLRTTGTERLVEVQRNLQAAGIAHAGVVRNLVQP